jgi:uroporphyrinogen-III synthase
MVKENKSLKVSEMYKNSKLTILSTRPVDQDMIDLALTRGATIDVESFIETAANINEQTGKKLSGLLQQQIIAVFTSINAVEAVATRIDKKKPAWKIFCVGNATRDLIKNKFGEDAVIGKADSAAQLADVIIAQRNIAAVVYFCGDRRRDELPDRLSREAITVHELAVYKTKTTARKIDKQYDAVLFFSPSAADSFFSMNSLPAETILFAIGDTTANAIKKRTNNTLIIGQSPGKKLLVAEALDYFQANHADH